MAYSLATHRRSRACALAVLALPVILAILPVLMMVQSIIALGTVIAVGARAINILGS
jgi:hypothetical protein